MKKGWYYLDGILRDRFLTEMHFVEENLPQADLETGHTRDTPN